MRNRILIIIGITLAVISILLNGVVAHDARFWFDKSKAAFRAGRVGGDQWDNANVGNYSYAFGRNLTNNTTDSFMIGFGDVSDETFRVMNDSVTVTGKIKIVDGSQGANKVLTSDANGVGTWSAAGSGDITGPDTSTDHGIARFNGTTGKIIQDSGVTIDDSNNLVAPGTGKFTKDDATASGVTDVLTIEHTTTGSAAAGIGTGLVFNVERQTGYGVREEGSIDTVLTSVTQNSETADMLFSVRESGTMTEVMRLDGSAGAVGIGTDTPSEILTVVKSNDTAILALSGAISNHTNIAIGRTAAEARLAIARATGDYALGAVPGDAVLRVDSSSNKLHLLAGGENAVMTVTNTSVGISSTTPTATLTVGGNIKAILNDIGGVNAKYDDATYELGYDMAELFETSEAVEPGDVLIIGSQPGKLQKSERTYEKSIVGVVSGAPAILFEGSQLQMAPDEGSLKNPHKPPVALVGRVPVKVTLENGPIKVGDYLTTSSKAGYAMRATEPGSTIGIALESFGFKEGEKEGMVRCFINIGERNMGQILAKLKKENMELREKLANLGAEIEKISERLSKR